MAEGITLGGGNIAQISPQVEKEEKHLLLQQSLNEEQSSSVGEPTRLNSKIKNYSNLIPRQTNYVRGASGSNYDEYQTPQINTPYSHSSI